MRRAEVALAEDVDELLELLATLVHRRVRRDQRADDRSRGRDQPRGLRHHDQPDRRAAQKNPDEHRHDDGRLPEPHVDLRDAPARERGPRDRVDLLALVVSDPLARSRLQRKLPRVSRRRARRALAVRRAPLVGAVSRAEPGERVAQLPKLGAFRALFASQVLPQLGPQRDGIHERARGVVPHRTRRVLQQRPERTVIGDPMRRDERH